MSNEHGVLFLGARETGKSALIIKIVQNHFITEYDPTFEDSYRTCKTVDGEAHYFTLLEVGCDEVCTAMRDAYIRKCETFCVVYSITDHESLVEAEKLIDLVYRTKDDFSAPTILIQCKSDLKSERKVKTEEGKALAERLGIPFLETSAKNDTSFEKLFETILSIQTESASASKNSNTNEKDKKCLIQ